MVPRDDRVRSGGKSAFENPVVGLIIPYEAHRLPRMDEYREAADCPRRLSYTRGGPAELASQDARDLIEDRRGYTDLDQAGSTEGQHFVGGAGEVQPAEM